MTEELDNSDFYEDSPYAPPALRRPGAQALPAAKPEPQAEPKPAAPAQNTVLAEPFAPPPAAREAISSGPVAAEGPQIVQCWHCRRKIHDIDHYCRHCGKGQGAYVAWTYKWPGIIILTFGLGPFVLWYVWRSPVLGKTGKTVYSVLVLAATAYLLVACYHLYTTLMGLMTGGSLGMMQSITGI